MKFVLFSKIPALIESENVINEVSLSKPIVVRESQFVKVYPQNEQFLPFCLTICENSKFLKITHFNNFEMLEIVEFPEVLSGSFFLSKSIKGGNASVVGLPLRFNVALESANFSHKFSTFPHDIKILETQNVVVMQSKTDGKDFDIIFHKVEKKFYELYGDIELSNSKVRAIIDKNTLVGHGEILEYQITDEKLSLLSSESVYLFNKPRNVAPFLFHIAFFEAVREKDYSLALTYLDGNLAEKLSVEHLEEFFGDFDSFKVLNKDGNLQVAIIKDVSLLKAEAKVFNVKFADGKIYDISEE